MAEVPLLNGQDASGATSLEAQYLSEEQPDFGQVIAHDPEGVVAYIEKRGVQDLGSFKVQVPAVAHFDRGQMPTVASILAQLMVCIHSTGFSADLDSYCLSVRTDNSPWHLNDADI